jgi:hypothetical protein
MRALLDRLERLDEATFNVDKDVEFLYKKANLDRFHKLVIGNNSAEDVATVLGKIEIPSTFWRGNSGDMVSRDSKKAHKVNPVDIRIGAYMDGSYYNPVGKVIQVSLHSGVIGHLQRNMYRVDLVASILGSSFSWFQKELNAENVKGTIAHELAHWLDDSLHGMHITHKSKSDKEAGISIGANKFSTVDQTPMEFEAQIHAIKTIRKQIGKRAFDKLTWGDLFHLKGSLMSNFSKAWDIDLSSTAYEDAMKRFVKRLAREGLLGNGLKNYPSSSEFSKLLVMRTGKR